MVWSLHQLAPICPVPHCSKYGTRHLLPHQEKIAIQILTGEENYIYYQGGVGSAKSLLWGVLGTALAIMIPQSRGILFRKDLALNYETLWGYFKNSVRAAFEEHILVGNYDKCWSVKKAGEYTYCTLPNGSVVRCGQTKNWSEYMGPTYDYILVSDAMENPDFGTIFHGEGVVGGLQSRLRGQKASFYQLNDNSTKDMRRFLIETNPPPNINELHAIFGREPGVRNLTHVPDPLTGKYITYRHIQSSTIQNDHNPSSYVAEISSQHNTQDVKRILGGKTIPYYGGIRVITSFVPEIHVNSFTVDTALPLFIGIDNGGQHSAVTFSQIRRCGYEREHYITLSEISNLYDKTIWELVTNEESDLLGILPHLALFYPTYFDYTLYKQIRKNMMRNSSNYSYTIQGIEPLNEPIDYSILENHFNKIRFCIDRSANKRSTQNKDRKTDNLILLQEYGIRCKSRTNIGLDKSLERVIELHKRICLCNIPERMIDRKCGLLIDAYSGGYRYSKKKDGTHSDKPIEDHVYEDISDADRYSLENFYFTPYMEYQEEKPKVQYEETLYAWMLREDERRCIDNSYRP